MNLPNYTCFCMLHKYYEYTNTHTHTEDPYRTMQSVVFRVQITLPVPLIWAETWQSPRTLHLPNAIVSVCECVTCTSMSFFVTQHRPPLWFSPLSMMNSFSLKRSLLPFCIASDKSWVSECRMDAVVGISISMTRIHTIKRSTHSAYTLGDKFGEGIFVSREHGQHRKTLPKSHTHTQCTCTNTHT